jgi:hypothetical protein
MRPMTINCVNYYLGYDGHQYYYHVQCGVTAPTIWQAHVSCANGITYYSGVYSTYQEVWVYCPVGTKAVQGGVSYSG